MAVQAETKGEMVMMDGERVDATLDLVDSRDGDPDRADNLVLTELRLIHVSSNGHRMQTFFVSIQDITAIDVLSQRSLGLIGYVWGALALVVALAVWQAWDNPVGSAIAGLALAAMGVYLVVDRLRSPSRVQARFRASDTEFTYNVNGPTAIEDTYEFVNKLFLRKEHFRSRTFSPR